MTRWALGLVGFAGAMVAIGALALLYLFAAAPPEWMDQDHEPEGP